MLRKTDGLAQRGDLPAGAQGGEPVQHIPAHGVDGGGGHGQTRLHLGANFHTAVGGAAGFTQTLCQRRRLQGHIARRFGYGTLHPADAPVGVGYRQAAANGADHGAKGHIHQRIFHTLEGLPRGLQPDLVLPPIGACAEHF